MSLNLPSRTHEKNLKIKPIKKIYPHRGKLTSAREKTRQGRSSDRQQSISSSQESPDSIQLSIEFLENYEECRKLNHVAFADYIGPPSAERSYRRGLARDYCVYLLLDPRILLDFSRTRSSPPSGKDFHAFLKAIFHIELGRFRTPFEYLRCALSWRQGKTRGEPHRHATKIVDIWNSGQGVIVLWPFSSLMYEQAMIIETAMIDALASLGINNWKGYGHKKYFGYMSKADPKEQELLGKFHLYIALKRFMFEGPRQIFADHFKENSTHKKA